MDIIAIVGIGIVTSLIALLFRQYKPEFLPVVTLASVCILFVLILAEMIPAFATVRTLMEKTSYSTGYIKIIMKSLGICYLSEIGSQLCKEAGQTAVASKVELAGKIMILLLSLPMLEDLLATALSFMSM